MLGDFGAEVVKIEPPGAGDPMREWGREKPHGMSLWWPILARHKKSVTLNLRTPEGQALARRLISQADVLVENFRPGTLQRWGLAPADLHAENPRLIITRVTGLRAGRPVRAARRVRLDRGGDGRHPVRDRRSGQAAVPRGGLGLTPEQIAALETAGTI
ncbi:CoA transferase [Actinomadura madurae]|uniref:CoA transferase n=1 Tax=Actinomadura madurae TaxID=1993 RepID=UPI003D6B0216